MPRPVPLFKWTLMCLKEENGTLITQVYRECNSKEEAEALKATLPRSGNWFIRKKQVS